MRKFVKWILAIAGTLTIIAIVVLAGGYAFLSRTVPDENGTALIPELSEEVMIIRDKEAVPHITGKSIVDVAAAQGYVHAQDRMWQMETLRMAGQGRLSEMFGKPTIETDRFLRTLNLAHYSRESYKVLAPETRELLQAYTRGINAYLTRETGLFEPRLAPEFMILGHKPDPWEPWQSLMSLKVMALTLGGNMSNEIRRLALASKGFSPNEIEDLITYHSKDNPPPLPDLRKIYGFKEQRSSDAGLPGKQTDVAATEPFELVWPIGVTASNNWVISGKRTKSGNVLLANDPHLGLTAPSIWQLNHLSWEHEGKQLNAVGASLPSIPMILLGRNDHIAWGFTTSNLDSQDLYVERINPENENEYLTDGGWKKFETRKETIKVSKEEDVEFEVRITRHGPVLPDAYRNIKKYLPANHLASLKWLALREDDTSIDAMLKIAHSQKVDDFIEAVRSLKSPMQSIVIGDNSGNIGFIAPSRVAIRKEENLIRGRAPVPGWLPEYEWEGFLEFEQLPQYKNPENGVLFSANSKFVDDTYQPLLTWDWAEEYRHDRVQRLITDQSEPHDVSSMKKGQLDDYSPGLVQFRDYILTQLPSGLTVEREMVDAIKSWDGRMTRDGAVPLIMMGWFKELSEALLKDDLGDEFKLFSRGRMTTIMNILKNGGARDWCDDFNQSGRQTCVKIISDSLIAATGNLGKEYGQDWKKWQWGKAHIAYGEHRPFAQVPALAKYFNVEIESGGGPYTLLRGQTNFGKKQPFYNRHASSYRAIYDLGDLENSLYIQTTGQSGNFLSPFYRNFAERWADGEYIKISTDPKLYGKDAVGNWMAKRKKDIE